jgi:hypothetical protein
MIKGDKGDPGETGPRGPSALLEISEAFSGELYGSHPHGFAQVPAQGAPLQCVFTSWDPGDILQVQFFCQRVGMTSRLIVQAQLSTNGGSEWHAVSGARAESGTQSASALASVALPRPPDDAPVLVRLHVTQLDANGPDYGPGPEGATLLLHCTRWRAGTYVATSRLTPPRT